MPSQETNFITLEALFNSFREALSIPSKEDLKSIHARLDQIEQLLQKQAASLSRRSPRKKKRVVKEKRVSAQDEVLAAINLHEDGADFKAIKTATGFEDKKIRNIIFRLDQTNQIERVKRGIYKAI